MRCCCGLRTDMPITASSHTSRCCSSALHNGTNIQRKSRTNLVHLQTWSVQCGMHTVRHAKQHRVVKSSLIQHRTRLRCSHSSANGCEAAELGVVIVDHGSRREASNEMLIEFCDLYRHTTGHENVEPAHMEIAEPTIQQAIGEWLIMYWTPPRQPVPDARTH